MKKLKELGENKMLKISFTIVKVIFVIFVLTFILMVYLQRFSNNRLSLFNYRMFTVVSGSMEPKYTIGDVLIAKKHEASEIKVGDDISYEGKLGDLRDKIVTHQVMSIDTNSNGYIFHTKGIANLIEDPVVGEEQVLGVVVYRARFLSLLYKIIATNIGFFLCIIIPLLSVFTYESVVTLLEREERKRAKNN